MAPNFNSLTDRCFLLIFDNVPLQDLLVDVGLVSHRWRAQAKEALTRRRTLILTQGFDPLQLIIKSSFTGPYEHMIRENGTVISSSDIDEEFDLNQINCNMDFSPKIAKQLATMLPNINNLQVAHDLDSSETAIYPILTLLRVWTAQLVSFSFWANYSVTEIATDQVCDLFLYLNKLPKLKQLTFEPSQLCPKYELYHFYFFAQLNELKFAINQLDPVFFEAWKLYIEPNQNLKQVALQT